MKKGVEAIVLVFVCLGVGAIVLGVPQVSCQFPSQISIRMRVSPHIAIPLMY